MEKHSQTSMSIERLPDGGYVVMAGRSRDYEMREARFATYEIDEALSYVRDMITPAVNEKQEG